jgi:hypothetical protein
MRHGLTQQEKRQPQLSRSEVLGRLATGGMAEVWLARAIGAAGFEKRVVEPNFFTMFVNEGFARARVLSRSTTKKLPLDEKVVARIAMDAASGLDYALVNTAQNIDQVVKLTVEAGGTAKVDALARGALSVKVDPWASVKVDGNSYGQTPVTVKALYEGSHLVELHNVGLNEKRRFEVKVKGLRSRVTRRTRACFAPNLRRGGAASSGRLAASARRPAPRASRRRRRAPDPSPRGRGRIPSTSWRRRRRPCRGAR